MQFCEIKVRGRAISEMVVEDGFRRVERLRVED